MTDTKTITIIVIAAIAIACVCVALGSNDIQNIQGAQVTTIKGLLDDPSKLPQDEYEPGTLISREFEKPSSEGLFERKNSNADMASKFLQRDAPFYKQVCFSASQSLVPMYGPAEYLDLSKLEFSLTDSIALLCEFDFGKMAKGLQSGSPEKAMEGVSAVIKITLP
ncbi:hypothetical protein KY336_04480 [Candidatus Woesearchaeota archaeon]|nr:hypothetical protein [Candidatus Woesearchaeota archaeon]